MAEMDLLRYVEVLSTVSGGSIVGALYVLLLKERIDRDGTLTQPQYVDLLNKLQDEFVRGVQKDLRNQLLMNPLGMLSVFLSHDNLSRRMGRIYQRYLYRGAVEAIGIDAPNGGWLSENVCRPLSRVLWPGWIPLQEVRFAPARKRITQGLESYNESQLSASPPGSAVPNLILNSTALNSAAPFRFSSVEIGDPRLGYFRFDEIAQLKPRKPLLDASPEALRAVLQGKAAPIAGACTDRATTSLALWWLTRTSASADLPNAFGEWQQIFPQYAGGVLDSMCRTNFGRLRQLKLAAWYLLEGPKKRVTGGATPQQHCARFNDVLSEVEPKVPYQITQAIAQRTDLGEELLRFALELYYLRSTEMMSPRLEKDLAAISLGTAVCASANFPPIFSPLILLGIYDDLHVSRLGLSDGGVYDNMGVGTLLEEGCTHIIASDTGAPFEVQQRASSGYLGMVLRLPSILTEDVAEQQRTQLRERRRVSQAMEQFPGGIPELDDLKQRYGLKGLAFFTIDSLDPPGSGPGIDPACDREDVARLRTDLDSFGDLEVAALINSGYDRADRFLHAYFTEPPYDAGKSTCWNSAPKVPRPVAGADAERMAKVLRAGRHRFFRALRLGSGTAWGLTIILIAATLYLLRHQLAQKVSAASFVNGASRRILNRLENPLPRFWSMGESGAANSLVTRPEPLYLWITVAVVAAIAYFAWLRVVDSLRRKIDGSRATTRKIAFVVKWIRALAPISFLGIGLAPVWLAIILCVVGILSYFLHNIPFLWATKMSTTETPMSPLKT